MKRRVLAAALALSIGLPAYPKTAPALAGISFLLGHWTGENGSVAETGGTSAGTSAITLEPGGFAMLRLDHTVLSDASGKPAGSFDIVMLIYPEAGTLHADYADGTHVIHYTSATITPGRTVTFSSAAAPGAPAYRLTYQLTAPAALAITFGLIPPGQTTFQTIATGTLMKAP